MPPRFDPDQMDDSMFNDTLFDLGDPLDDDLPSDAPDFEDEPDEEFTNRALQRALLGKGSK